MQYNDNNNEHEQKAHGINDPDFAKRKINAPDFSVKRERTKKKCPNCKDIVEQAEMCPSCNHYMGEMGRAKYQPMSRKTRLTVKIILAVVFTVAAVILLRDRIFACG